LLWFSAPLRPCVAPFTNYEPVPPRHFTLNTTPITTDAPDHASLLEVLRDHLHLTGTKLACDRGECGACTVLVDNRPAYACITLAASVDGCAVRTIEGLEPNHPVPAAFAQHDAAQCGYCTPGQVMAAVALLEHTPSPDDDAIARGMSGNLCRCGTYPAIREALRALGAASRNGANA
jgi:xanthine dehydrogenase YagT iron-sulfur-binding subunit